MVVRVGPREDRPSIAMVPPLALRRIRAFGSTLTLQSRRRMLAPRCERSPIRSLDALPVRPTAGDQTRNSPRPHPAGLFFVTGTAAVRLGLNTYGGIGPPHALFLEGPPTDAILSWAAVGFLVTVAALAATIALVA